VSTVSEAALQAETITPFFFSLKLVLTFLTFLIISASICGFILFIDLLDENYPEFFSKIGWMSVIVILAPTLYVADCFFTTALAALLCHLIASVRRPRFSLIFPILLALPVSFLLACTDPLINLYDKPLLVLLLSNTVISLGIVTAFEALGSLRLFRFNQAIGILLGAASITIINLSLKAIGYPDLFTVIPEHPLTAFVLVSITVTCILALGGKAWNIPHGNRQA